MRRLISLAAGAALIGGLFATTPIMASAAQAQTSDGQYTATGRADLLDVDLSSPLGGANLVDIEVTPSIIGVDSTAGPRSNAYTANLNANALAGNIDLSGVLSEATQSAPPDNADPNTATLLPVDASPLVNLGVSNALAHARWPGDGQCLAPGEDIARARVDTAEAVVISDGGDPAIEVVSVNNDGGVTYTQSRTFTDLVDGQEGRLLSTVSETSIDTVTLFGGTPAETNIEIAAIPSLTATATGSPGGASVDFQVPLINISGAPGDIEIINLEPAGDLLGIGLVDVLDDVTQAIEDGVNASLGEAGLVSIDIVLGADTMTAEYLGEPVLAADGTAASGAGAAVLISIEVLAAAGDPLLTAYIPVAPMSAAVTVPAGGIICGGPPENPIQARKDASQAQVAPGSTFTYTLEAINHSAECTLTNVVVTDELITPLGTSVTATPAADSTESVDSANSTTHTFTWNLGDLGPLGIETYELEVAVPANAPEGFEFHDELTVTGTCDGNDWDDSAELDGPIVIDSFLGSCDLSLSKKSTSHLDVVHGQEFDYTIAVLNRGTLPCEDVTVVDVLDDRVSFVRCTDGCTDAGQVVTWELGTIEGSSSEAVTVTVKVNDGTQGVLANTADISTPSNPTDVSVSVTGPRITDVPVIAPPGPPAVIPGTLARTGQDTPLVLLAAMALLGLAGLSARRRFEF